jgi:hypothetical protein
MCCAVGTEGEERGRERAEGGREGRGTIDDRERLEGQETVL